MNDMSNRHPNEVRDIYEAELNNVQKLLKQSEAVLIEARGYVDANSDDVRGEYISDTWDEDVQRSVANINATLASITTYLSKA